MIICVVLIERNEPGAQLDQLTKQVIGFILPTQRDDKTQSGLCSLTEPNNKIALNICTASDVNDGHYLYHCYAC